MKKIFMKFLALAFPWMVLFIYDNPSGAILALVMQATLIGWIPASIWAIRVVNEEELQSKGRKKEQEQSKNQSMKN